MKAKDYPLNAQEDMPDMRDYIYEPALLDLRPELKPRRNLLMLDQGREGACTGFSLAATINFLQQGRGEDVPVSPRMLYEMAKISDEWPGEDYDGSSLRGAISGWKNMGVCQNDLWPYEASGDVGDLSIEAAKNARRTTVGAYYRLRPVISHFHAALAEVGVIAVSARVHSGWFNPGSSGRIRQRKEIKGAHAFVIVGYDDQGFFVQNSWGPDWGQGGVGHWLYEDWIENVMDAWVVRLALPTPQIFGKFPGAAKIPGDLDGGEQPGVSGKSKGTTPRSAIAGHFVHIDDGAYHEHGRYWSKPEDVKQTARLVADSTDYDHLVIYAHGGLNAPTASAARIAALREGFKRNRIYPFHFMYDTGLGEELKDIIFRKAQKSAELVGAFSGVTDRVLEGLLRVPGTLLWDEMKRDAALALMPDGAGTDVIRIFIRELRRAAKSGRTKKIHIVGHSTGAILLAHFLRVLQNTKVTISSCHLMAPASTVDLYHSHYRPILQGKHRLKLRKMGVYCLEDRVEKDDTVGGVYRKSLLYLVSNAFERDRGKPLLGMEKFHDEVQKVGQKLKFHLSNGYSGSVTRSKTHGGFDNDSHTMNHILAGVLGKKPSKPFTTEELDRF